MIADLLGLFLVFVSSQVAVEDQDDEDDWPSPGEETTGVYGATSR